MNEKTYDIVLIDAEVDNIRITITEKQLELLEFLEERDCLTCTIEDVGKSKYYDLSKQGVLQ